MNNLQKAELTMLIDLIRILSDNQIEYSLLGGTAIGAFRESGFVPWDDDIDICIKDEDITKLEASIADSKFVFKTKLDSQRLPHIKIYDPTQFISEKGEKGNLFIDVFPAYKKREFGEKHYKVIDHKVALLSLALMPFSEMATTEGKIPAFFAKIAGKFIHPRKKIWKSIFSFIKRQKVLDERSETRVCYGSPYFPNLYEVRFDNLIDITFESNTFMVSKSFPEDNRHIYGDVYKKPDDAQIYHHDIKLIDKEA